jgi:DNA topoisomerase VI subunit B
LITESYQRIQEISDKYDDLIDQIKRKEDLIKKKELEENKKIDEIQRIVNFLEKKMNLPDPQKIYSNSWDEFVA